MLSDPFREGMSPTVQTPHQARINLYQRRTTYHNSLIHSHPSVMVNISRLRHPDDRVDEDICLTLTCRTNGQLAMSAMHGVSGLESDDFAPREFLEVCTEFSWGVCGAKRRHRVK